ncbi:MULTISPECIES: DUF6759 domain-containing protein [Chryseobacterium]|uniref:DUF6759 domain-containing protein n=1 Tax=Chryseobacterium camelliae TaxID=1265445 RepID=A0ABU0TNN3_9FLAO|nr:MULTISPECIES: DUF6759 domain-containing protein [Chryseobacterium]MDT3408310.1 hypothetical protein [Pseudacidovorax intermedius]MDQ1097833.1 hypothetical protein [Chryseobacterium camelliae]MDQ1101767.1 hypothetical protein [Chryseobacterium sp. SORGH_AS_1048]MDR6085206.1 hypothetical protein [Chryseobacterium sp. SORGH_AS_0909]MDR6129564.1 hypothetical protein [Chryseobacterium sp. SORGH_AS_1175]
MKNTILMVLISLLAACSPTKARKENEDILTTTDISRIEKYLASTYPDDPRRSILKPKLIALKNAAWTKGRKDAKPMEARPVMYEISGNAIKNSGSAEAEEFKRLITATSQGHTAKTLKLLNTLFDQDISSKEVIILFRNLSDCNMILRIQGKDFYNLAVPAKGDNFMVINKGNYKLTSNVCDVIYSSSKNITSSLLLTIQNPAPSGNAHAEIKK